jgi:hypothetical protein
MNPAPVWHFSAGTVRTLSNVAAVSSVAVALSAAIIAEPIVMGVAAGAASIAAIARIVGGKELRADAEREHREKRNSDKRDRRRLATSR